MKRAYGFTIVELLIVIVVIAILAALSYVGYANITQKAENNKNIVAMEGYLKAFKLYQAENGTILRSTDGACLGKGYPWDFEGASSGVSQCWSSATPNYYTESKNVAIGNELGKYVSPMPQPSMRAIGSSATWRRGIVYYHSGVGGNYYLAMPLAGSGSCPNISGYAPIRNSLTGGMVCTYVLGPHTD